MSPELAQTTPFRTLSAEGWQTGFSESVQQQTIKALESGQLIYFPQLAFHLFPAEMPLLTTRFSTEKRKNISYNPRKNAIHGMQNMQLQEQYALRNMLARYCEHARQLVENLFPSYQPALIDGRTSYRPIQITDRPTSKRKDDKLLHVDAFPASPNQGKRILRVFCNINPHGEDRLWRIGEPFENVADRFLPQAKNPRPSLTVALKLLGLTKGHRTAYDHYMLQIHDLMKNDDAYQQNVPYVEMRFPPGSTWIVQTDQVSHAAMAGQYVLEQTFYLPIEAMQDPRLSPLRVLEKKLGRVLRPDKK
jgi:hypothetical protein